MTSIKPVLAAAIACLVLAACAGGGQSQISAQQREALTDDMLEPNDMTGGFMPGLGIGSL